MRRPIFQKLFVAFSILAIWPSPVLAQQHQLAGEAVPGKARDQDRTCGRLAVLQRRQVFMEKLASRLTARLKTGPATDTIVIIVSDKDDLLEEMRDMMQDFLEILTRISGVLLHGDVKKAGGGIILTISSAESGGLVKLEDIVANGGQPFGRASFDKPGYASAD